MSNSNNIEESPDFLHFKHKYGFLENFTELYRAFFWSCQQRQLEINHERCDAFFQKYTHNMGLRVSFDQANIDPRSFTICIQFQDGKEAVHKHINAGRLHEFQPNFIPIISINNLTSCSMTIDGITYKLELEEE